MVDFWSNIVTTHEGKHAPEEIVRTACRPVRRDAQELEYQRRAPISLALFGAAAALVRWPGAALAFDAAVFDHFAAPAALGLPVGGRLDATLPV